MHQNLPVQVKGHVLVEDDLGNVLLDKENAVHPQNMSRIIARALSNESNYFVHRIAYGNGGTSVAADFTINYNDVNDGQAPDTRTWDSRLYNETYSEIIDEGNTVLNTLLGTDPGSAGPNAGTRAGGGSAAGSDPDSTLHVSGPGVHSNELGLTSEIVITSVLNPDEPTGQFATDTQAPAENTDTSFTFDEIGLYTTGAPASDSNGTADLDVGNRNALDDTGLLGTTQYSFNINVDGGGANEITFTTPASGTGAGGAILYGDLIEAINTGDVAWNGAWAGANPLGGATVAITSTTNDFSTIIGAQTYGFMRFTSDSTGVGSSIVLTAGGTGTDLIGAINSGAGATIITPVDGLAAGVQNAPTASSTERERLLTHLIFSPVLKSANRTLTVTYTLTVSVARSQ